MRLGSKQLKRVMLCLSVVCLAALLTPTTSAVSNKELLRVEQNQSFQGLCCFSWRETVQVTEPQALVPVVVTWSTDYQATGSFFAGLSVNGGPCAFHGSGSIQPFGAGDGSGDFDSRVVQWVVLPSDGLVSGNNKFTLCGGTIVSPTAVIYLGFNTLAARTAK